MMVTLFDDDILQTKADVIVAPVNRAGVAGAGLAKAIAAKYPDWQEAYHLWCRWGCPEEGIFHPTEQGIIVYNAVTKVEPNRSSTPDLVRLAVEKLAADAEINKWQTVAVPALGCGLGGLDYRKIIPYLCWRLWDHHCTFHVYLPGDGFRNQKALVSFSRA